LRVVLAEYPDLQSLIDATALDPPESGVDHQAQDGSDRLILSTVHSAKGLEWDAVFVIHLVEGKFPSAQAELPEQMEEERRLLYVAATRARKNLYLVYPRQVVGYDRSLSMGILSPFLAELPPGLLQTRSGLAAANGYRSPSRPTAATAPVRKKVATESFSVGMAVRHPFFGEGRVEAVVPPRSVDVQFVRHGKKTLHLDYAKLEVVG